MAAGRWEAGKEPRQTTPKGFEIPVPKRKVVMDALRKIARRKRMPRGYTDY